MDSTRLWMYYVRMLYLFLLFYGNFDIHLCIEVIFEIIIIVIGMKRVKGFANSIVH